MFPKRLLLFYFISTFCCLFRLSSSLSPLKIQTTENMESRIVGGVEAGKHEFPWVVRLQYKSGGYLLCGGAIISPRSILTAAHCFPNPSSGLIDLEVLAGAHDINNASGEANSRQVRALRTITCHSNYNDQNMQNDICILTLTSDLQMTEWVTAVPIADEQTTIPGSGTVAGWGMVTENGAISRVLRKVSVPMVPNPTCSNAYSAFVPITGGMMCAGASGKDSCQGDSGGPLMCTYDANGTPVLFACGIVSFGLGCGDHRYPGVYTRISYHRNWIYALDNSTQFAPTMSVSTGVVVSAWTLTLSLLILAMMIE